MRVDRLRLHKAKKKKLASVKPLKQDGREIIWRRGQWLVREVAQQRVVEPATNQQQHTYWYAFGATNRAITRLLFLHLEMMTILLFLVGWLVG